MPPNSSQDTSNLPPPEEWYPYREFYEDIQAVGATRDGSIRDHFFRLYPDSKIFQFRVSRLIAAARYLQIHLSALNRGSLSVVGKEEAIVAGRVYVALWRHWARPEIDPNTYDPPIEEFIHTCENLPGDRDGKS